MRHLLLALLMLWAAAGLLVLVQDLDGGDLPALPGGDDEEPGGVPRVVLPPGLQPPARPPGFEPPAPPPQAVEGEEVPYALRAVSVLAASASRRRAVLAWLDGRPHRLVALLQSWAVRPAAAGPDDARLHFQRARDLLRSVLDGLGDPAPWRRAVEERVRAGGSPDGALLAALGVLGTEHPATRELLRGWALDAGQGVALRLEAARTLLECPPLVEADLAAVRAALALPAENATDSLDLQDLVAALADRAEQPAGARLLLPLLGDLLALHDRERAKGWIQGPCLRALLALAPRDPEVRARVASALGDVRSPARAVARRAVLDLPLPDALDYLLEAPAGVQVEGLEALLAHGASGEGFQPVVLRALQARGAVVRARAVALLGKAGGDVAAALPVVEALLGAEDHDRWLTGVQALGALKTVPGDHEPVIARLLAVARWPEARVRTAAVQAVLTYDARPAAVLELLTALVDDADAGVRREAVDGLGEMLASEPAARKALEAARTDSDEVVRELVVYWLDHSDEDDGDH